MTPETDIEEVTLPTKTYLVQNGRIMSFTDGRDAMRQAIEKVLLTARFSVPWLSPNYGHDLDDLIGKSVDYALSEVERMVKEALLDDDRVTDVTVESLAAESKTTILAKVSVTTIYGQVDTTTEVAANDTK
jgi:Protein of unknown function (DUF2634).